MKCKNCGTHNQEGSNVCKKCGVALNENLKKCVNGHMYDTNLENCPFCPLVNDMPTYLDTRNPNETKNGQETVLDNNEDKTVIDKSAPTLKKQANQEFIDSDKTQIISYDSDQSNKSDTPTKTDNIISEKRNLRKLIGWLVTYDKDPNGIDFRLYEGRTRIGRNDNNDVVIKEEGVSDSHAVILYRTVDNVLVIQDQLTTNGTFVNGKSIGTSATDLHDNDKIKIGVVNFKLKIV